MASVLVRVEALPADEAVMQDKLEAWFVAESLAVARVVEGAAVVASDFRIDPAGHMRFAVFVQARHRGAAGRTDRAAAVRD